MAQETKENTSILYYTEDNGDTWKPYTLNDFYLEINIPEESRPNSWIGYEDKVYSWTELQKNDSYNSTIFKATIPNSESNSFIDRSIRDLFKNYKSNLSKTTMAIYNLRPIAVIVQVHLLPWIAILNSAKRHAVTRKLRKAIEDSQSPLGAVIVNAFTEQYSNNNPREVEIIDSP